jgi:hypothetical protein
MSQNCSEHTRFVITFEEQDIKHQLRCENCNIVHFTCLCPNFHSLVVTSNKDQNDIAASPRSISTRSGGNRSSVRGENLMPAGGSAVAEQRIYVPLPVKVYPGTEASDKHNPPERIHTVDNSYRALFLQALWMSAPLDARNIQGHTCR